jgi:hypothetical protein
MLTDAADTVAEHHDGSLVSHPSTGHDPRPYAEGLDFDMGAVQSWLSSA